MPRYFLNLRRGPGSNDFTPDPEGDELADESLLRPHVLRVARAVMRTRSHAVRDWMTCSFEITDEQHHEVAVIPFTDLVTEEA